MKVYHQHLTYNLTKINCGEKKRIAEICGQLQNCEVSKTGIPSVKAQEEEGKYLNSVQNLSKFMSDPNIQIKEAQ